MPASVKCTIAGEATCTSETLCLHTINYLNLESQVRIITNILLIKTEVINQSGLKALLLE